MGEGIEMDTETMGTEPLDMPNWQNVVALIQADLREGHLAEEAMCQAVVLITKRGGDYYGIGLIEVVRKVVMVIINFRLSNNISFHDVLHGFWEGRGMENTSLEAKILQHLTAMREEVLYKIFLDLHKVYDSLDREICLEILEGYGLGLQDIRLLYTC